MHATIASWVVAIGAIVLAVSAMSPAPADARSPIRVGVGDQSPAMFSSPQWRALNVKRTRYFAPADVMQDVPERLRARAYVIAARAAGVSTLLHLSTADLRPKQGRLVSTGEYSRNVGRIVAYFRNLGVRDFGAWNEVNHKTQETWDSPGHPASYFQSMYRAVKLGSGPPAACRSCSVVGLDLLDQAGVDRYVRSVYARLSATWRKRLTIVGIHNYSDVNRNRSTGTSLIIRSVRRYNPLTKFWFTETGALASFGASFAFSLSRQASRLNNMFTFASRYRRSGVARVYSYNWFGIETGPGCGRSCRFDAGLVNPNGSPRPAYGTFATRLRNYSR